MPLRDQFDPTQLTPDASLNKLALTTTAEWAKDLRGRRVIEVLGGRQLAGQARPWELAGRGLAALVETLQSRDTARDQGWSEWRAQYLSHWRSVSAIRVGGGTAAALGQRMIDVANALLHQADVHVAVELDDEPLTICLRGALGKGPSHRAVALDFGQTTVKRVVKYSSSEGHQRFEYLPPISVSTRQDATRFVVDTILRTAPPAFRFSDRPPHIRMSIASYIADRQILSRSGFYCSLEMNRVENALTRAGIAGGDLSIDHDGTCAARTLPEGQGAVLVLGTAVASGFPTPTSSPSWSRDETHT
jgi:hypothetical protein